LLKKIIYDSNIFYLQKYGGISKYFINLVKNLDKKIFLPKIIAPIYINDYLENIEKKYKKNFLKINSHPRFTRAFSNLINDQYLNIYSNFNKPDIIHSTYFKPILKKKAKLVITVYDLIHEIFRNKYNFNNIYNLKKKSIYNADKIICISENTKKDLIKYYNVDNKKISVILLGKPNSNEYKIVDDKFYDKPYMLFVGDRKNYKNFISFITAFSLSERLKKNFNIVCFGGTNFSTEEYTLFKNKKINIDNIKYISGSDLQLNYLYKKASLYVCPSLYEGFGLTILEAMNMNCPIIASETSSIKEIGEEKIAYFNPRSIDDICFQIENFVFNEEKKNNMLKSYKNHLEKFSWKKNALETEKLYSEII